MTQAGLQREINFDFCETLPVERVCGEHESLATEHDTEQPYDKGCINLTQKPPAGENVTLVRKSENVDEHLLLEYSTEEACAGNQTYGISYEIFCSDNITDVNPVLNLAKTNDCRPYFEIHHQSGCKVADINAIWQFMDKYYLIFGISFMVVGLFTLTLGLKLIRPTLAIIFCLSTIVAILFVFYVLILPNNVGSWVGWLLLAVSIVLGCIIGFFASKLLRVGVFFLGVWAGIGVALLLNNVILFKINSVAVLWISMAVLGLLFGVLSFFWYMYIVIVCTSIIGSYLFVRGISLFAGGYPNEFTIYERIRDQDMSRVPLTFYLYLAGIIICVGIGIFIQIKIKNRSKEPEKPNDYYRRV